RARIHRRQVTGRGVPRLALHGGDEVEHVDLLAGPREQVPEVLEPATVLETDHGVVPGDGPEVAFAPEDGRRGRAGALRRRAPAGARATSGIVARAEHRFAVAFGERDVRRRAHAAVEGERGLEMSEGLIPSFERAGQYTERSCDRTLTEERWPDL